jgi:hypothetical protein
LLKTIGRKVTHLSREYPHRQSGTEYKIFFLL